MPTYDYECTQCGKPHQAQHSMSAPKPKCPSCGGELTQVILMAPAVSGANFGAGSSASAPACETPSGPSCSTGTCPFQ